MSYRLNFHQLRFNIQTLNQIILMFNIILNFFKCTNRSNKLGREQKKLKRNKKEISQNNMKNTKWKKSTFAHGCRHFASNKKKNNGQSFVDGIHKHRTPC